MPLTREFKETVMELAKDREFRIELLREAVESYVLQADIATGNAMLRDYLNATSSFEEVASDLKVHVSSLRRMLSDKGNARSRNLFNVLHVCMEREGIHDLSGLAAA